MSLPRPRIAVLLQLAFASAAQAQAQAQVKAQPKAPPGVIAGYLAPGELPDSVALLPPAPVSGSPTQRMDDAVSQQSLALRGTKRWALAVADADLTFPNAAADFTCALGAPVTAADTPHLYVLLRRTLADAGLATRAAKQKYGRPRPFTVNNAPLCTPESKTHLSADGSYPSGHASIGFAWALVLAEVSPERTDALLRRGEVYGQSRLVCNVHWQSDVMEGQFVAAATVARLHGNAAFLADLAAARQEVAAARAKGLKPTIDCAQEAAAIALDPLAAPYTNPPRD